MARELQVPGSPRIWRPRGNGTVAKRLRDIRTMRDVWDERRKDASRRPERSSIVRRFATIAPAKRHRPPKGAVPLRTWVFSKPPVGEPPEKQLLVKRTKEPPVDLFDEKDKLIVLAELPGLSEEDVRINVQEDLLIIEAVSADRPGQVHYYKEVMLPYEVDQDFGHWCKSGLLEIHLQPERQVGKRKTTKPSRGSSIKAPPAGKKKKRRKRKRESRETGAQRQTRTRPKEGPKRKS